MGDVLIYLGPFLVILLIAKRWLARKSVNLSDVQAQAGPNRGTRWVFLYGWWRNETRAARAPI